MPKHQTTKHVITSLVQQGDQYWIETDLGSVVIGKQLPLPTSPVKQCQQQMKCTCFRMNKLKTHLKRGVMLYSLNKKDWYACQHPTPKNPTQYSSVSSTETPTLSQNTAKTAKRCELGIYKKASWARTLLLCLGDGCAWEDKIAAFLRASLVCYKHEDQVRSPTSSVNADICWGGDAMRLVLQINMYAWNHSGGCLGEQIVPRLRDPKVAGQP